MPYREPTDEVRRRLAATAAVRRRAGPRATRPGPSKLTAPGDWLHLVIADILPAIHACIPIQSVTYGRVAQKLTR